MTTTTEQTQSPVPTEDLTKEMEAMSVADSETTLTDDSSSSSSVPAETESEEFKPVSSIKFPRSCLKRSVSANFDYPVLTTKKSWRQLAPPDMDEIRSQASSRSLCPDNSEEMSQPKRKVSVTFKDIEIREYNQTVGDHPNVSYGPPISLDWDYEEKGTVDLDAYEEGRGNRRSLREMMLNYYARKNTLLWVCGLSDEDLKKATKDVHRAQFQRGVTKYFLPVSKVEEVAQSAKRKFKRAVNKRYHSV
mmetsp:Transcript_8881/g.20550  ORF Transcript_8881/g.20550 Transcript_8881/m.20550 type:complete len:248 (-) Transcript_8881:101-844(-)|eukprot:CAMPEP_0116844100 /NCGR_PEP_ID=MMETSP0418-20121206/12476_1 /TAXON_ID=1158023 /ORGANISM="Astrosyne radiata, Strain 13vi08-1A" /LENGTH=247 /DNA_ID=CAMNT_0004474967 /DNA_START=51 /DNA_END=794 /DNA_ORIENTATION=+